MEEQQDHPQKPSPGGSIRKRVVLLCILPTVLLGVTYFFLIEYIIREYAIPSEVVPLVRYGGAGLVFLFTLGSLACGIQVSDGLTRPLRALVRVVEGYQIPPGQADYLPGSDTELRYLFLRVNTLVQQNRSGAQSLKDLESLSTEVEELRKGFRLANERLQVPRLLHGGGEGPTGKLTEELERFWTSLHDDLRLIEGKLAEFVRILTEQETAWAASRGEVEGAVREVERLGTVWSLEVELARRRVPDLPGSLGSCFGEFSTAADRLRGATRSDGQAADAVADLRSEIAKMRETVDRWLRDEVETERFSAPMRGEG